VIIHFRAILIVRHPLDATISVFNFFGTHGSHTRVAKLEKFLLPDGKPNKSKSELRRVMFRKL